MPIIVSGKHSGPSLAVLLAVAGVLLVASAILLLLRLLELPVVQLVFSVEDLAVAMVGKF